MKTEIQTLAQLKHLIEYIIWSYDVNVGNIADKKPHVIIQDVSVAYLVRISYLVGIERGEGNDPTTSSDDKETNDYFQFQLLKSEGFRQLTKYVEEMCEEIAKIEIAVD